MIVSFIIPTMGRLNHVKEALESVLKQPHSQVILVDWSCPDKAGDWAEQEFQEKYPNLKVIHVPNEKYFHLSRARNIGAQNAEGDFLCFLDCDMILKEGFIQVCLPFLDGESYIVFRDQGQNGFAGTIIVPKEIFEEVGGYNEALKNWGYEDTDFVDRVAKIILKNRISNSLATHIKHSDDERTKFYENKDKSQTWESNRQICIRQNNTVKPQVQDLLIPKIFHFIWLGKKRYSKLNENIKSWQINHPEWRFIFWTDQGNLTPEGCEIRNIEELFPFKRQDLYRHLSVMAYKANILRLEVIYRFGGIYVDTDFVNYKNIDVAISGLESFACCSTKHINNGIFGSIANSPWVARMLDIINDEPIGGTIAMTRATPDFPNVHIFEDWVFYPVDFYGKRVF